MPPSPYTPPQLLSLARLVRVYLTGLGQIQRSERAKGWESAREASGSPAGWNTVRVQLYNACCARAFCTL
jgi:hypothetical protein